MGELDKNVTQPPQLKILHPTDSPKEIAKNQIIIGGDIFPDNLLTSRNILTGATAIFVLGIVGLGIYEAKKRAKKNKKRNK